ncbi:MAG: low-specificity L-threonine aldolase [Chloroflexi bacterium]|nr:low-specificity L-threonine aldolase [Chloroflexota bacterium]
MQEIDLRSDTVTLPTEAMRKAMYEAELGDDVYGEDPTVNRLEEMAAERMGKEAALLVVSGTMGNLVSLLSLCARGDEVIMGSQAHIHWYEAGGISVLGGVHVRTVPNLPNGLMEPGDVEAAVRDPSNLHFPRSRAVCLENTHNRCGGAVQTPAQMATIKAAAEKHGLAVHLDGARIFNAAVALGIEAKELAAQADTVTFCLSKGLACPVGALICGSKELMWQARRNRKIVGGGMRQAGIIAAAGIVALEQMIERLAEDHENARVLAQGLVNVPGLSVDLSMVQSNMVMIDVTKPGLTAKGLSAALLAEGVKINATSAQRLRAVTHYGIVRADIDRTLAVMQRVMKQIG